MKTDQKDADAPNRDVEDRTGSDLHDEAPHDLPKHGHPNEPEAHADGPVPPGFFEPNATADDNVAREGAIHLADVPVHLPHEVASKARAKDARSPRRSAAYEAEALTHEPGDETHAGVEASAAQHGKKRTKASGKGLFGRKKQAASSVSDAAPADPTGHTDAETELSLDEEDTSTDLLDETAAAEDPEHGLVSGHRFGLRLGSHKEGNFLARLKKRMGKGDVEDPEEIQEREEEEAISQRIEPDDRYKEIETYPIRPPYAYVRILFDDEQKEHIYQVLEPALTKTEKEILDFVLETLVDNLTVAPEDLDDIDEEAFITDKFNDVLFDYSIILHEDEEEEQEIKKKLLYYIQRDFIGHGPIDVLMEDPYIEDISCDGPKPPIFIYHRKYESIRSTVVFVEHEKLDGFVIKMAQRAGKHISIAEPILDATMTDGSRLQSTLSDEVSAGGSTFTIRKFRPDPFTPPDLVQFRTMSAEMLAYLWISVQNGASLMYAGGTASGKTTALNAILLFIPPQMKIVSIEDTREVNIPHENWIAGITRHGFGPRDQFGRQAGEIDMFQLLKNALRQRPEYIIVGEVRGQEAYSLFQAMATGHAAYGTMHADSVDAVIHRLESDPINIPRSLLEALDIVSIQAQTRIGGKRVRRTKQISEIVGLDPHTREILTNEVFRWIPRDDSFKFSGVSYVLERIQLEKGMEPGSMVQELRRRARIIHWMIQQQVKDYREVSKVIATYYKEPESVMALVEGKLSVDEVPVSLRTIAAREAGEMKMPSLQAVALQEADGAPPRQPGDDEPAEALAEGPTDGPQAEDEAPRPDPFTSHATRQVESLSPDARAVGWAQDAANDEVADDPDAAAPDASAPEEAHGTSSGQAPQGPADDQQPPAEPLSAAPAPKDADRSGGDWGRGKSEADAEARDADTDTDESPAAAAAPTESGHRWAGADPFLQAVHDVERDAAETGASTMETPGETYDDTSRSNRAPAPEADEPTDAAKGEDWLQALETEVREQRAETEAVQERAQSDDVDGEADDERREAKKRHAEEDPS